MFVYGVMLLIIGLGADIDVFVPIGLIFMFLGMLLKERRR